MTTYRIHTKAGSLDATDHDRWPQPDGRRVPTAELSTDCTIPGHGRVVSVARVRVVEEASA